MNDEKFWNETYYKELPVICYDAQYNKHCNGNNIIRCYSWYDIYEKLSGFNKG